MADGDRISELYRGEIFDWEMQERARARVHWMCEQSRGQRVLDLGCSQGITSILLGREGFDVLGVDVAEEQVEFARQSLAQEPESVRERVRFETGDAARLHLEDESFDTVLAGELFEHLAQPERILAEVKRVLVPGGRLVVTAPFGLHPHPDHKQTFYLYSLVDLVNKELSVRTVDVVDKYIRLCADRPSSGPPAKYGDLKGLLLLSERALEDVELAYHGAIERNARRMRGVRTKADRAEEEAGEALRELERRRSQIDSLRGTLATVQAEHEALSIELSELRKVSERLTSEKMSLLAEVTAESDRLRDIEERLGEKSRQERVLSSEIQQIRDESKRLAQEKEQSKGQIARLRQEQARLKEERNRVNGLLDQAGVERGKPAWRLERFVTRHLKLADLHEKTTKGMRFQIGDAFVEAAIPSLSTAVLPFRLMGLVADGARKLVADRRKRKKPPVAKRPPSSRTTARQPSPETNSGNASLDRSKRPAPPDPSIERWSLDLAGRDTPTRAMDVKVAAVLDEFSTDCFSPEARLIHPKPDNWEAVFRFEHPHLLFVESAWKGNQGTWQYRVARYQSPPGQELSEMVAWSRRQGVPTVFWNKEDPVHFERFIDAARQFDAVLTTDANCIDRYRKAIGHDRVAALPFAAQPRLQNPIALPGGRNGRICFAGSYYANRHEDRRREMEMLLDAASGAALDIYDRNHGVTGQGAEHFRFPERFQPFILGRLPYRDLMRAYKQYRVFLNVNSVIDSPTMFSRRVFELLACGTPVVSTRSAGINHLLGDDVVWMVENEEQAREAIQVLMEDDGEWRRRSLLGIRRVMSAHTYAHRFAEVLGSAGIGVEDGKQPLVLLVASIANEAELDRVLDAYEGQGWDRRRLLVGQDEAIARRERPGVETLPGPDLVDGLGSRIEEWKPDLIGILDPGCLYGRHYLEDLIYAWRYSQADIVGKSGDERDRYQYGERVDAGACLFDVAKMSAKGWGPRDLLGDSNIEWSSFGARVFVADASEIDPTFSRWEEPGAIAEARRACEI